jgi:hypothetical protein
MAEAKTIKDMPADDQRHMCFHAAGEIEVLGRMLRREQSEDGFETLLNGSLIRLDALAGVLLSINGNDDGREWAEMHEVVFGEPLEVSHG